MAQLEPIVGSGRIGAQGEAFAGAGNGAGVGGGDVAYQGQGSPRLDRPGEGGAAAVEVDAAAAARRRVAAQVVLERFSNCYSPKSGQSFHYSIGPEPEETDRDMIRGGLNNQVARNLHFLASNPADG